MKRGGYLLIMCLGAGAFLAAMWFVSNDELNLMLIHPLVMLAFWTAQYGGAAAFLLAAVMLLLSSRRGDANG